MIDDLEHRLREARAGLHRPDDERASLLERAVIEELPEQPARRRKSRSRGRWYVLAFALALVVGASAVASGRLGDLFVDTPPQEVSRAFLQVGGVEVPNSTRGTTSTLRPSSTVAARLVVADTPWGRYTYWRGLDGTGQVVDLVQDPVVGFAGGGPCLAFDPVLPPAGETAADPDTTGPTPTGDVLLCGSSTMEPNTTPTVVKGAVSAKVARAEITYTDGRRMPAFVSNRSILVVVPPQTCDFGLQPPEALVLRDAGGDEIDRIDLGERGFDLGGWEINGPPDCAPAPTPAAGVASLFSVLQSPQEADDVLPAAIRTSGDQHLRPRSARLAAAQGTRRLYAVTAKPFPAAPETVCLVDVDEGRPLQPLRRSGGGGYLYGPGGSAGSDCPPARSFASSFQVSVLRLDPDGSAVIAGLVPDGFTSVQAGTKKAAVTGNAYLIEGVRLGTELRAHGPAGSRTVTFGGRTGQLPSPDRRILAR